MFMKNETERASCYIFHGEGHYNYSIENSTSEEGSLFLYLVDFK